MTPAWLLQGIAQPPEFPAPPSERAPTPAECGALMGCIDLTTLQGDDHRERIETLCAQARESAVAAVCVFPVFVPQARQVLLGSGIAVATVAGAFPHGLSPLDARVHEVRACAELGADEIDVVIRRDHARAGRWDALMDEVTAMKSAAGSAHLKVILATGELGPQITIYRAALAALAGGADFVKTSTGKEVVNATPEAGVAMAAALRVYATATGAWRGLKAAGGIQTPEQAAAWLDLVQRDLGPGADAPHRFRIGASALLPALRAHRVN